MNWLLHLLCPYDLTGIARDAASTRRLVGEIHNRLIDMEDHMSKNSDALANLDAQLDELVAYVVSDDATDAAEVQSRADRIKAVLAEVKGAAPVDEPAAPVDEPVADEGNDTPAA